MKTLKSFYLKGLWILVIVTILFSLLVFSKFNTLTDNYIMPAIIDSDPPMQVLVSIVIDWLSPLAIVSSMFSLSEWLLRKYIWRIFYPHLNLNGKWTGQSKFLVRYDMETGAEEYLKSTPDEFEIIQDCLTIYVPETAKRRDVPEEEGYLWHSLTADLDYAVNSSVDLRILYCIKYRDPMQKKDFYPPQARGYISLHSPPSIKGKKRSLEGNFRHCVPHSDKKDRYVFSGKQIYTRIH